jgi:DNA-binding XRE family transcriptional regulator
MEHGIEGTVDILYNHGLMPAHKVNFALLCRELRHKLKMTQEEMAVELGVHLRTYKRYEAGEMRPNADVAFRLCEIQHLLEQRQKKKDE